MSDPQLNGTKGVLAVALGGAKLCPDTRQLTCEPVGPITLLFERLLLPDPFGFNCRDAELDIIARTGMCEPDKQCQDESRRRSCSRKSAAERSALPDRTGTPAQRDSRFVRNCL
ncbi:hypothetical protein [Bradyrhizobium sp. CCGUVB14]|uniref:hypothetical protein n=1 Tax=Bradyrhizobium sp. CCGUVB14 TaxID=2949628 RepID=UPI0020B38684|nr:hypothetical protein [Bradyrhizobium sp. CCGUVB14]MCP3443199.1 hypothetical protein [Bradyrhizobium sp. CCGUVB14]